MSYIKLFPTSIYEYYGKDGIVFDLLENNKIYLDINDAFCFSNLLNGEEYVENKYSIKFNQAINLMLEYGMIYIYENKVYYETMKLHNIIEIEGIYDQPPVLSNVFIEASGVCSKKCKFCDMQNVINGCKTCVKWNNDTKNISYDVLIKTIERLLDMRILRFTILGGNPLENWDYVSLVINLVRLKNKSVAIDLYLPSLEFSDEIKDYLKANEISIKFVNVSDDECLTLRKSITEDAGLDIDVISIETIDYGHKLDNIRGFEERKAKMTDEYLLQKKFDRCLKGKIALSLNGDVKACPASEDIILNVRENSIEKAFYNREIEKYWQLNRDDVTDCKDCPMKWLCYDCIVALKRANKNNIRGKFFCGKQI